jgi:hypothetical protein
MIEKLSSDTSYGTSNMQMQESFANPGKFSQSYKRMLKHMVKSSKARLIDSKVLDQTMQYLKNWGNHKATKSSVLIQSYDVNTLKT